MFRAVYDALEQLSFVRRLRRRGFATWPPLCSSWPRRWLGLGVALVGVFSLAPWAERGWLAREVLLGLARAPEASDAAPPAENGSEVRVWDVQVPLDGLAARGRFYARGNALEGERVILVHGVHHLGIDEPRLVKFARELAKAGRVVFTPEIEDLTRYHITERSVAQLTDAGRYLVQMAPDPEKSRVGLIGFSFAGGLSLVAGGSPELSEHLSFVASIGGHHDLSRVLRFFMDQRIETPSGLKQLRSHEYGLVVLTYECLPDLLPPEDVPLASSVLRAWLMEDRATALALMADVSSEQAERLFALLERGELSQLRPQLRRALDARQRHLERLSPSGKLSALRAPAYLLHGSDDTVIPPSETAWADIELARQEHSALVSPLLRHVALKDGHDWVEQLRLLSFVAHLL